MAERENKSPAFQMYPAEFLSDFNVVRMTAEQRGAYIVLICHCWLEGSLPADEDELARVSGTDRQAIAAVMRCFCPHPDDPSRLVHPRLEKERAKQKEHREKMSEAGRIGNEKRWNANKKNVLADSKDDSSEDRIGIALGSPGDRSAIARDRSSFQSLTVSSFSEEQYGTVRSAETETGQGRQKTTAKTQGATPPETPEQTLPPALRVLQHAGRLTGDSVSGKVQEGLLDKINFLLLAHAEEELIAALDWAWNKPSWKRNIAKRDVKFPLSMFISCLPKILKERESRDIPRSLVAAGNPEDVICEKCQERFPKEQAAQHVREKHPAEVVAVDGVLRL